MEGSLTLDSRSGWQKGGDRGPSIVPGNPDASLLIHAVRHNDEDFQMPPDDPLPKTAIALLTEWVRRGAPDPRLTVPDSEGRKRSPRLVVAPTAGQT